MNLNDLNEAPMGMLNKFGQKILSKIPGSIGHQAKGKLDTGRVANLWKDQYMKYLGQIGQKHPSSENLSDFLKSKGFTPDDITNVIKESSLAYERILTGKEVDSLILKAVQQSASRSPSGRVEPQSDLISPNQAPNNVPTKAPPVQSPNQAPNNVPTKAPLAKTASPVQKSNNSISSYLNSWTKDIKSATSDKEKFDLAREMIKFLSDRKGSPEAKSGAAAAMSVLKRMNNPLLAKAAQGLSHLRMERANYIIASNLLKENNIYWKDLGYKIVISESTLTHVVIACR